MKNALYISGNIFSALGLLLIGIGVAAFQSLTSMYKYLSQFATMEHQAWININTVLWIGGIMIAIGVTQIVIALVCKKKTDKQ